jgi:peptidoglycan/xylan/chitin deacetylase (PgdA/CDA1 family)
MREQRAALSCYRLSVWHVWILEHRKMAANTQKPTQICISIDTEFSIAGHFEDPLRYKPVAEPMVYGEVDAKEEALGFLLDVFDRYQITATFFVECANYFYFGDEPMRGVVKRLKAAAQDIQLHIHPVWLSFNQDPNIGTFPRHDDCSGREFGELKEAFRVCIDIFERWVGRRPLAIRTGSMRVDETVYRVMRELEIPLSSNVAMGIYPPIELQLRHDSGRHNIHGVIELPIFTYLDGAPLGQEHKKSLQITSCSWPEMKYILRKARKLGIETIVVLTHPSEYIKKSDFQYRNLTRNRVNQARLENLCEFIRQHPEEFVAADFGSQLANWRASELHHETMRVPHAFAVGRKLHNKLNDLIWRY